MRRPRNIELTLLAVVAALVTACENDERHCVDETGRYVADAMCVGGNAGSHWVYVPHTRYSGLGSPAGSWSTATSPHSSFSGTSRGGFGSIGEGHASGGGGGGE